MTHSTFSADTSASSNNNPAYWLIVPAAGVGKRMGAEYPKQYLKLGQKTILEHSLEQLLRLPELSGIYVALGKQDEYWSDLAVSRNPLVRRYEGGAERADSVLNGLLQLPAQDTDWVLVHDAARPCITIESIQGLISRLKNHPVGGILGVPVSDTLKHVNGGIILETRDRNDLWQAQTPQMFRVGLLRECLQKVLQQNLPVTDEASAVEACGFQPLMVPGRGDNIKITRPEDLIMGKFILEQQARL
jgi:2-C-methyl-D-erythritol 4-phosphate cytidylyltransferase